LDSAVQAFHESCPEKQNPARGLAGVSDGEEINAAILPQRL
jgi:hypothetical protein